MTLQTSTSTPECRAQERSSGNVSAFNYLYDDIQVGQFLEDTEIIVNGAKAKMYGADIDAELVVVRGLTLNGGFSSIHDRFLQYPDASFIVPVGGCVPAPGGVCTGSAAGKELPYTPTTSFNLGGDYKWELPIGAVALDANYFRSGSFYGAPGPRRGSKCLQLGQRFAVVDRPKRASEVGRLRPQPRQHDLRDIADRGDAGRGHRARLPANVRRHHRL